MHVDEEAVRIRMAKRPGLGFIQARNEIIAERIVARKFRRANHERIKRMADKEWNALEYEPDPVRHASRHLASLSPERRAELERDWE